MGQIIDQRIIIPVRGINDSLPEWRLDDSYTPDMKNSKIEDGIIKDRDGYSQVAASFSVASNNPVMCPFEWGDSYGTIKPIFVTTEGLVEFTSPSTWTARFGAVTLSGGASDPIFATPVETLSSESLYFCNGSANDTIKVWTGTGNWTTLSTTGKTNLKAGCAIGFNGHLVLGDIGENGSEYPFQIMWSNINDPTTWNGLSAGFANLTRDKQNSRVQTMIPIQNALMVYKRSSIYLLTYQGDPNYFVGRLRVPDLGVISRKAVATFDDFHFFVSEENIHVFDGTSFVKPAPGDRIKKQFFNKLNWSARDTIFTETDPEKFEAWIFFPEGVATSPNSAYCWNWRDDSWTYHTFADTIYSAGRFVDTFTDREICLGLNADVMYFQNGADDNGTAIDAYWRTPLRDYGNLGQGLATSIKTVRRVEWDVQDTSPLPKVQIGTVNNLTDTVSYTTAEVIRDGDTGVKMTTHNNSSGRFITYKMTNDAGAASYIAAMYYPYVEFRTGMKR